LASAEQPSPIHPTASEPPKQTNWESRNPTVREFLRNTYGGHCQICHATFARRDGTPYFEARYLVPRTTARWVEDHANALCLCPTCFAKLLYGSVRGPDVVEQLQRADIALPSGAEVSFDLCGETVQLHVAQRHLVDIQALLATGGPDALLR
jgi:hypothetical protein